ncbi:MAG TPA: TIGR03619 family F420-dependent LLM class oxidoreductase [Mycobacteriales bacterium]|jgi:probable F420-dependent oxidoreductase|nr:TIGR03619 family F420-dependent LLM class oxidoreductase [Mycobacteriales bacterium]
MTTPTDAVRLGFGLPVSGTWATAENMVRFARRAEELGYSSLWSFQRLLNPAAGDYGDAYRSVQDPLIALAYAAAVTSDIRLGTAVVNAPFYAPIVLAKQVTTLDHLSGGRIDLGLGLGWAPEEFTAVGMPYERRGARVEEFVACLRAIWTDDPVSFDGEFYELPPVRVDPHPIQRPTPPVLLGGAAEAALRRAGRIADGWISASRHDLTRIGEAVATVRGAAEEAGRDPAALRFVVRGVVHLDEERPDEAGNRRRLTGTAGQIKGDLETLHGQGITDVFLDLNFNPRVGSPDADLVESTDYAQRVLEELAP